MADTDARNANLQNAAQIAETVLQPYANSGDVARQRNLQEIMKRAARFAYMLFSHPSFWRFDWQDQNGMVVFPALVQVTNEAGVVLPQAASHSQREVVRI